MRTVLLFPGALGDLVLLAPAVSAVAARSRVEISVRRAVGPVASRLLPAALGPPIDGAAMSALFGTGALPAPLASWLAGTDVAHAWLGRERTEVRARLAGATGGAVHLHAVERSDGVEHVSRVYAAHLGIEEDCAPPEIASPVPAPGPWTRDAPGRLVIHPGAGGLEKRWPTDAFLALADAWRTRGGEVTALLGPAEQDLVGAWCETPHHVASDADLETVLTLLASAPRFVGNDSGISHLAGALGRWGAVLFGPTNPGRWRPLGGRLSPMPFRTQVAEILDVLTQMTPPGCLDTLPNRH